MTREKVYTAADVAEAFQAGLALGQGADYAPGAAEAYVDGYARGLGFGDRAEDRHHGGGLRVVPDDNGHAENFLARQRAAREEAREVVYEGAEPPSGLDPEVVGAARRIARRLEE